MRLSIADYMDLKSAGFTPQEITAYMEAQTPTPTPTPEPTPAPETEPKRITDTAPNPAPTPETAPSPKLTGAPAEEENETKKMVRELLDIFHKASINNSTIENPAQDNDVEKILAAGIR